MAKIDLYVTVKATVDLEQRKLFDLVVTSENHCESSECYDHEAQTCRDLDDDESALADGIDNLVAQTITALRAWDVARLDGGVSMADLRSIAAKKLDEAAFLLHRPVEW